MLPQPADPALRYRRAVTLTVSGELWFLTMMLSCLAIEPSWDAVRRGLSYYGNSGATIVPYALGFGLSIVMTALGLAQIDPDDAAGNRFRRFVAIVLALMLAIPFTPYRLDLIFDWLHIGAATALFASGLVLGGWLARASATDYWHSVPARIRSRDRDRRRANRPERLHDPDRAVVPADCVRAGTARDPPTHSPLFQRAPAPVRPNRDKR